MTATILATLHFGGNFDKACRWLQGDNRIPMMLGKSRYGRRLQRVSRYFVTLFEILAQT